MTTTILSVFLFAAVGVIAVLLLRNRLRTEDESSEGPSFQWINELEKTVESLKAELAQVNEDRDVLAVTAERLRGEYQLSLSNMRSKLELEFAQRKREEAKKTAQRSRTALVAKVAEHMAPYLAGFPYNPKEVRHWGEIFDFLVLDGLENGKIAEIVFLEVKTSRSGGRVSNPREKLLRDAVEGGRVRYEVWVPDVGKEEMV